MLFKNMKNLALSAGVFTLILCTFSGAYALEGSVNSGKSNISQDTYQEYVDQLTALKADLQDNADKINDIIACQRLQQVYRTGGCNPVYLMETDPEKALHADDPMVGACNGPADVRHFNGTSWECKTLTTDVSNTVTPTTYTYSWVEGSWTSCFPATCGSETKPVDCVRNDGLTVASSYCSGIRPSSWRPCNVPWNKRFCEEGICVNNGLDGQPIQHCP